MTWIAFLCVWYLTGVYGYAANWERFERMHRPDGWSIRWNMFHSSLTMLLGPIGVALVMIHGGRWNFWKKYEVKK